MPDYPSIEQELTDIKRSDYSGAKAANNLEEYWIGSVGSLYIIKLLINIQKDVASRFKY